MSTFKHLRGRKSTLLFGSLFLFLTVVSCKNKADQTADNSETIKGYQDSIALLKQQLEQANNEIELLKYPADQRLNHISELMNKEEYDKAQQEIVELKRIFPNAKENAEAETYITKISEIEAAKKAEEERLKALGFKALAIKSDVTIGDNNIVFSNMKIGPKFTHDVYPTYSGSEWREHTADKGSSYISCNMDITSTSKDPDIPTISFYSVEGEKLIHQKDFWVYFARWESYGCYLGNEPDLKNDFSKVNTVKFRLGIPMEDSYLNKPYVVVLKMENTLSRKYDRYENPPVSYSGYGGYPSSLTIDDFKDNRYVALKIANI